MVWCTVPWGRSALQPDYILVEALDARLKRVRHSGQESSPNPHQIRLVVREMENAPHSPPASALWIPHDLPCCVRWGVYGDEQYIEAKHCAHWMPVGRPCHFGCGWAPDVTSWLVGSAIFSSQAVHDVALQPSQRVASRRYSGHSA